MTDQRFLIALGGNMPSTAGPPEATLKAGLSSLQEHGVALPRISRLYRTPCFPAGAGPDYVNAAAHASFHGTPAELLDILHQIEAQFGRARIQRWGQRTLDLDLLAAGDTIAPDREGYDTWRNLPADRQMEEVPDQLVLPHPRMHERAFVLVPLNDVASDWVHPILKRSVTEMLAELPDAARQEVVPID